MGASVNLFSTDVFLSTLARVYFPGRPYEVNPYRTAGRVFRLLSVDGKAPITLWPFFDFVLPLEPRSQVRRLSYLLRAVLENVEVR